MENIFLSKQVFAKLRLIRTLHVAANVTTPGKSILNTIHSFNRFLDSTIRSTWKFPLPAKPYFQRTLFSDAVYPTGHRPGLRKG